MNAMTDYWSVEKVSENKSIEPEERRIDDVSDVVAACLTMEELRLRLQ